MHSMDEVLPVHTGMIPVLYTLHTRDDGAPRAYGDDPSLPSMYFSSLLCSPPSAGMVPHARRAMRLITAFPAHARMPRRIEVAIVLSLVLPAPHGIIPA